MSAFLFPGQGSQYAGMGADLYERFPAARALFDEADDVLGFALTELLFGDDEEALRSTDVTQPALYTHSAAAMAVLEEQGLRPERVAGHSLGEYSALAAAGVFSFAEGLRAVRLRGQLMAEANEGQPGTMAAVLMLDDDVLEAICEEVSEGAEVVQPANYNAPGQIVISGAVPAVERAMELASERGARKVVSLNVGGAFHSPLMAHAQQGLAEHLEALDLAAPRCPVYPNVSATATTDPDEIRRCLIEQLQAPVRWAQTLRAMQEDGAERYVEVGAGRVLSGLVKRTLGRRTDTSNFDKVGDFA